MSKSNNPKDFDEIYEKFNRRQDPKKSDKSKKEALDRERRRKDKEQRKYAE